LTHAQARASPFLEFGDLAEKQIPGFALTPSLHAPTSTSHIDTLVVIDIVAVNRAQTGPAFDTWTW